MRRWTRPSTGAGTKWPGTTAPQADGTEGLRILNDGEPGLPPKVAGISLVRARFRTLGKVDQAALLPDILMGCPGHALRFEGV
jgi:hypothetical protein